MQRGQRPVWSLPSLRIEPGLGGGAGTGQGGGESGPRLNRLWSASASRAEPAELGVRRSSNTNETNAQRRGENRNGNPASNVHDSLSTFTHRVPRKTRYDKCR